MDQDIKLYAEIRGELHEITVINVNKTDWTAFVSCKNSKPFFGWDGWDEVYTHKSSGVVSLSAISDEFGRVIPLEAARLAKLSVPVEFHNNILHSIESV